MDTMNTKLSIPHIRITTAIHASNPIKYHNRVQDADELIQRVTLGKRLEEWRQNVYWLKGHRKRQADGKVDFESRFSEEDLERNKPHAVILMSSFEQRRDSGLGTVEFETRQGIEGTGEESVLLYSENGFVWSVIHAYCGHHHLTIRPEDIWFAILTQFNSYLNAHAEEFRHIFVTHEGKKELKVTLLGDRFSADCGSFAEKMAELVQENILEEGMRDWFRPGFSTSTANDDILASVLMMANMQNYFEYTMACICGIPSVTLLGERSDYEKILGKLDRLERYGLEPTLFAALLRPIIKRMIASFDDPTSLEVVNFWRRIADPSGGDGPGYMRTRSYRGWITAFCFWEKYGACRYYLQGPIDYPMDGVGKDLEALSETWYSRTGFNRSKDKSSESKVAPLELDGVRYGPVSDHQVPSGFSKVPVRIEDIVRGQTVEAELMAGSVGISCEGSGMQMADGSMGFDSMRPVTGWWMAELSLEKHDSGRLRRRQ